MPHLREPSPETRTATGSVAHAGASAQPHKTLSALETHVFNTIYSFKNTTRETKVDTL